uniref:protein TALPID3 n=1 Tax=Semicossyphus pulcher TaxID=241346 RepID=UPI0037E9B0AC
MLSRPASGADRLWDPSGENSPDQSSCSSDTGDVLIRSTRVLLSDPRYEAGPGPGSGSVQITVQKLRDPPAQPPLAEQQQSSEREEQQRPKPRRKPDGAAPLLPQPDRRRLQKPEPTKENREPRRRHPAAQSSLHRKLCAGTHTHHEPGHDLLTSRFAAGGRGVVLAALKQRSHSTPHRREVKVQLLDPGPLLTNSRHAPGPGTSSQDALGVGGIQTEAVLSSCCPGDATSNAAAASAAAPLIKAQSDLEARVCLLADGVEKLLQADREGGDRGRSLSQQTLQHLETLHSHQLQLQSQLLKSALRMVTGHAPVTSDPIVTSDLTAAENVLSIQQRSSPGTAVETETVAMATHRCDRGAEQTRERESAAGSHPQSLANHTNASARRANEMLKEMGRLRTEMKMLLTPEDSLKTTGPEPDHYQTQQGLLQSRQSQQNQSTSSHLQPRSNQYQSQQSHPQSRPSSSQHTELPQSQQTHSKSHHILSQSSPFQKSQQSPPSMLVQRRPVVPSMLEEAGRVLHQVRRQKKVLEENLEALLRAKTGEVLHCQLEALAANRDWTEEVRIKKTVDAWISTLSKDIQAEMSSEGPIPCRVSEAGTKQAASKGAAVTSQRAAVSSAHTGSGRPVGTLRGTGSKTATGRGSRGQTAGLVQGVEPLRATGGLTDRKQVEEDGESYLTRLYGRAPYEGMRRTLKKSPYLRFSSPASPLSRKPRPRLVESVRGVKVKCCKTQTCLAPPLTLSPSQSQHRYIISSSHMTSGDPPDLTVTPADHYPVPMAIPLGRPRMDSSSRCQSDLQQEVTSPPSAPPTSSVVAMKEEAPVLQSVGAEQLDADEAPPPSVDIIQRKSEEEDEENVFPGADFLSVADVTQQDEVRVGWAVEVELDGGPSPPPVLYQGPVFPPQARSALPAQDQTSVLGLDLQRDVLETRLVEWVEQQLMSRMISEMYRSPPSDPAQNDSTDQSEPEQSVTSDAGGGGMQLFVDSNVSLDSVLIRQLVNEVLTEQVALMLGHRDTPEPRLEPKPPEPGAQQEDKLVPLVPTPVATPPPSPTTPSRETPPLTTPPPSEPTSLQREESPQPITAPEPVATPTSSPEPAHSAGSPVHQTPPPLAWGGAELPLDEERPEEDLDTHPQPLLMSVAQEEPPLSSPHPPPCISPAPSPSPPPPPPDLRPASPCSSSEDSSSTNTSSTSNTSSGAETAETEAALKHISEGELLISINQLAAMTEGEAVCSFSSSLQELQEMDFDPPSEGQVRGHSLLLTLLAKMEQGVTHTHREERPEPEVVPVQVRQSDAQTAEQQQGGGRRRDVHLPCITPEQHQEEVMEQHQEEVTEESVSAGAVTDSSVSDVF